MEEEEEEKSEEKGERRGRNQTSEMNTKRTGREEYGTIHPPQLQRETFLSLFLLTISAAPFARGGSPFFIILPFSPLATKMRLPVGNRKIKSSAAFPSAADYARNVCLDTSGGRERRRTL